MKSPSKAALDELEVLERVTSYHGSPTLRGKRPLPAQYMGLLRFMVDETPRFAAALERLIDRGILTIVSAGGNWVLAEVGSRGVTELDRLRAATTDPVVYLKQLLDGLRQVQARIQGGVEDPLPVIAEGQRLVEQVVKVAEGLEKRK